MIAPKVSIVVASRDAADRLLGLLDVLATQTRAELSEVVVVLDGCTDDSALAVRRWQERAALRVQLLEQPRPDAGAARNRGVAAACGDIILFLEDRLRPEAELVERHLVHHDHDCVVVGDVRLARPSRSQLSRRRGWRLQAVEWARREDFNIARAESRRPLTYRDLPVNNLSLRRSRFVGLGGFDEGFGEHGGEALDLGHRLLRSGCKVVVEPRAVSTEVFDRTITDDMAAAFDEGWTDVRLARRHPELTPGLRPLRPRRGVVRRLEDSWFDHPALARAAQLLFLVIIWAADNLGFHGVWRRARRSATAIAYWRGVASASGSRGAWDDLRSGSGQTPAVEFELADDAPFTLEPRADVPAQVNVTRAGRRLALVELPAWGSRDSHALASWIAAAVPPDAVIQATRGAHWLHALAPSSPSAENIHGRRPASSANDDDA